MDAPDASRGLVLVVDDDARTARRLATLLREDGFLVEVAVNGAVAIGRLSREPTPHALVTDLQMPLADGSSVVRYARSREPGIVVVVVTGHPNLAGDLVEMSPEVFVMPKPLEYERLLNVLADAVKQPPLE